MSARRGGGSPWRIMRRARMARRRGVHTTGKQFVSFLVCCVGVILLISNPVILLVMVPLAAGMLDQKGKK